MTFEGLENVPAGGGCILVSNHRSYLDPVFLGLRLDRLPRFMAKKELFDKPVLGGIIRKLKAFPVERGKGDGEVLEQAQEVIRDGDIFAIFPEGTRSKDGRLLKFKSGAVFIAAGTHSDVIPVAICFDGKLRFRSRVTVRFGTPIPYEKIAITQMNASQVKHAKDVMQQRVAQLLAQGVTKEEQKA